MKNKILFVPLPGLIFCFLGLMRFSQDVRTVNVVGLFASGAIAGAVFAMVMGRAVDKRRREPEADLLDHQAKHDEANVTPKIDHES